MNMEDLNENIEEKYAIYFDAMIKGKVYFMKEKLTPINYILNLNIEFNNCFISIAPYGGLVSFCKKSKVLIAKTSNPLRNNVIVMCQDGSHCKLIPYDDKKRNLILFGFNFKEKLYGIHDDGSIIKFDIDNEQYNEKYTGESFKSEKIVLARYFEKGFMSQTNKYNIYYIKDIENPLPYIFFPLYLIGISKPINEYIFLPPSLTVSKKIELIIPNSHGHGIIHITGKGENEKFEINENGYFDEIKYIQKDKRIPYKIDCGTEDDPKDDDLGHIVAFALSPSNTQIAMYRNDGTVFFFHITIDGDKPRITAKFEVNPNPNDDFENEEQYYILNYDSKTTQFLFCGEDAVCLCGGRFIMILNSKNKTMYYKNTDKVFQNIGLQYQLMYCFTEVDGLRIITHDSLFFISKVSKELFHACYDFSNHCSKKLLNSYKLALMRNPNSDKEIREIFDKLGEGILTLLSAASRIIYFDNNHYNKKIQFYLLKAAQYGKNFVQYLNYDLFVQYCKEIRVLNNLHICQSTDLPRFITYAQYKSIGAKELIKRLIRQKNFALAYDISKYLNLDFLIHIILQKHVSSQIKKLGNGTIEEQLNLYEKIFNQIKDIPNISYIELAKKAFKYGANEIGTNFLKEEKSILTTIPQYIQLKEWKTAISHAIATYDKNVLFSVIDQIFRETIDNDEFINIVSEFDKLNNVVIDYLKAINEKYPDLLYSYLNKKQLFEELFFIYLEKFFEATNLKNRKELLVSMNTCIKKIKSNDFDYNFYKNYLNSLESSISFKINIIENGYIPKTDTGPFDNSIYDCYKICINNEDNNLSEKENKKHKLSDKRYLIIRLRTYAEMKRFDAIDNVLNKYKNNLKKLNLTPFDLAELYYDFKQYDKATEYIKQMVEPDIFNYKIQMLKSMEKYEDAIELIISDKNCEKELLINDILNKRPDLKPKYDELIKKSGK